MLAILWDERKKISSSNFSTSRALPGTAFGKILGLVGQRLIAFAMTQPTFLQVMSSKKICRAYNWQPGDFIIYEPDE